ncbi:MULTISPECIES: hypothetical protein [unclassified Amycolatopsis]|uniref:hypothetical protein n=1 Tax=unclassified Amycolatopsis TaxID=2618356 RepID=UPI0028761192|nr:MULTISPECIES: hypothetical protein [unclassified Amycolatopsis]MDS0132708.1 hypothetical protein [Amycolatopsis sp. 505]MDS0142467.1 hypothetical protein [Amycolatopsis sp. CM201R]
MAQITAFSWVSGEISGGLVAICPVAFRSDAGQPAQPDAPRRPENPRRKHMVLAALIVETGIAVVVAGALAAWSRKRFTPRHDAN